MGLIANTSKPDAPGTAVRAARLIDKAGRTVLCDQPTARISGLKCHTAPDARALASQCDLLLVMGGDGTMLRVAREVGGLKTPLLGINLGNLGFLTAVVAADLPGILGKVWNGKFTLDSRPLIAASGVSTGSPFEHCGLNDMVINRSGASRMVELDVEVNGQPLTRYRCDGLVVCSPTGSTAYSLSAGGAIVSPDANVFTLTPICPHTLSNRSVIVGMDAVIRVTIANDNPPAILTADGQVSQNLSLNESVTIRRSRRQVRLLRPEGSSFYDTLRRKLHWSGSHV